MYVFGLHIDLDQLENEATLKFMQWQQLGSISLILIGEINRLESFNGVALQQFKINYLRMEEKIWTTALQ